MRFEVSAAGVQNDEIIYNDTWMDDSWDAVWTSAVHHDEQGWSVEMRIPFSELRFLPGDTQTWGVNASRVIQRKNEIWTPARLRSMPMPIRFGGVPTGVAMPPAEAA